MTHVKHAGDPTRVAAGPLGTSVMAAAAEGGGGAYGLKLKGMMMGGGSDRLRAANKSIANLVQKMGLPDEVKHVAQVHSTLCVLCWHLALHCVPM